jgi:hypothetical protein
MGFPSGSQVACPPTHTQAPRCIRTHGLATGAALSDGGTGQLAGLGEELGMSPGPVHARQVLSA